MAKWANDEVLDAALLHVRNNASRITICTAQPLNFTEANTTLSLGGVTVAAADFAISNGSTSGRKITVAGKSAIPVDVAGTATHVAVLDVTGSRLLYVTTAAPQAVSGGGTFDVLPWEIEIGDPV